MTNTYRNHFSRSYENLLEVRVGWWYKILTQVLIVGTDIKLITAKPTEITYILSRLA